MTKKIFWMMMLLLSLYSVNALTYYFNDSADVGSAGDRWLTVGNQYYIYDSAYSYSPTKSLNQTGLGSAFSYNCTKMNPNTGNYSIDWKFLNNGMINCCVMVSMETNSTVTSNYYNTAGFNTWIGATCPYGSTGISLHDAYDNTYVNCGSIPVGWSNASMRWNRLLKNVSLYINNIYVCSKIMNDLSLNVQCIKGWGNNAPRKVSLDDIQVCDGLIGCNVSTAITNNFNINLTLFNSSNINILSLVQEQLFYIRANFTNNNINVGNGSNCTYNSSDMKASFVVGTANYTLSTGNYDLNMSYTHGNSSSDGFIIRMCAPQVISTRDVNIYVNNDLFQTVLSSSIPLCVAGFHEQRNMTIQYQNSSSFNVSIRCPTCNSPQDVRLIINDNFGYVLINQRRYIPYTGGNLRYNNSNGVYQDIDDYHSFVNNGTISLSVNCNNTNVSNAYNVGYVNLSVLLTEIQDNINGNRTFINGTNVSSIEWNIKGDCSGQLINESYFNLSYSNGTFIYQMRGEQYINGFKFGNAINFSILFYCMDNFGNRRTAIGNFFQVFNPLITYASPTLSNNSDVNQNPLVFNFTNNFNATACYLWSNYTNPLYSVINFTICNLNVTYNYTANFTGNYNFTVSELSNIKFITDANYTMYNRSIIFHYAFNNLSAIGESMATVVDLGLFGHNATTNGTNFTSNGKYDTAINSSGAVSSLTLYDTQHLSFTTGKFTLLFWAKMATDDQSTVKSILNKLAEINIQIETDEKLNIYTSNDGVSSYQVVKTTNAISGLSGWKYYAIVISGASSKIYIDNVDTPITITNVGSTIVDGGKEVRLFQITTDNTSRFDGTIDDMILFNRTLSANEISRYYYSSLKKLSSTTWNFLSSENGRYCFTGSSGENCTTTSYYNSTICNDDYHQRPYHDLYFMMPLDIKSNVSFFVSCNTSNIDSNGSRLNYKYDNINFQQPISKITSINGNVSDNVLISANIDVEINFSCTNDTIIYSNATINYDNGSKLVAYNVSTYLIDKNKLYDGNYTVILGCFDNASHTTNVSKMFMIKDLYIPSINWLSPNVDNGTQILQNTSLFVDFVASDINLFSIRLNCYNPLGVNVLNLFATNLTGTSIKQISNYTLNQTVLGIGFCNVSVKDAHTKKSISAYDIHMNKEVIYTLDSLLENNNNILNEQDIGFLGGENIPEDNNVLSIDYEDYQLNVTVVGADEIIIKEKNDRYTFEPEYSEIPPTIEYLITCTSEDFYKVNSGYSAHFICGNLWIDLNMVGYNKKSYHTSYIGHDEYSITVPYIEDSSLETESFGVVNEIISTVKYTVSDVIIIPEVETSLNKIIGAGILIFLWLGILIIGLLFLKILIMFDAFIGLFIGIFLLSISQPIGWIFIMLNVLLFVIGAFLLKED